MIEYTCNICGKKFDRRSNWNYHVNIRKRSCVKLDEKVLSAEKYDVKIKDSNYEESKCLAQTKYPELKTLKTPTDKTSPSLKALNLQQKVIQCPMCDLNLSSKFSLQRHLGKLSCPKMKNMLIESGIFVDESNEKKVINNINTLNNDSYNTSLSIDNSNNITNNNLQLSDYSAQNYDSIPLDVTKKCLGNGFDMVPKLIKHTHCNDKYPQYRNIRVTNLRSSHIDVRENGVWKKKRKGRTILKIMHDAHNHLESVHDSLEDEDYKGKSKAERYFNAFFNDQEKTEKRITDDIIDNLYNETHLLKK